MFKYILPTYPVPDKDTGDWSIRDLESLSSLEEFVGTEVQSDLGEVLIPGAPMRHQIAISRLMSGQSSIRELMLIHDTGTGKSASAIYSIQQNLGDVVFGMRRGLVLVPGPGVRRNFINELEKTIPAHENRKWTDFYKFFTFETFSQYIRGMSNEDIKRKWNSTFIIIDEAHLIGYPSNTKNKTSQYDRIAHFIETLPNRKLLILSGTPARDNVSDFGNIFNLMLPKYRIVDNKKVLNKLDVNSGVDQFLKKYLPADAQGNRRISDELLSKLAGKVSFLAGDPSDVMVKYQGKPTQIVKSNIVVSIMSQFQAEVYFRVMQKDLQKKRDRLLCVADPNQQSEEYAQQKRDGSYMADVAYQDARQASRFVFPDQSFGSEGYAKYMLTKAARQNLKQAILSELNTDDYLESDLSNREGGRVRKQIEIGDVYKAVSKFSKKYADMALKITADSDVHQKSFVYDKLVEGSGLKVFALVLELFGFRKYSENSQSYKSYAILTGENTSKIQSILNAFNDPVNVKGRNIMVLLGSDVLSTSHTLKDVMHEHVSPHWNDSETTQVIGRGIRTGSHKAYKSSVPGVVTVNVYKRASVYPSVGEYSNPDEMFSVDLKMYHLSQTKRYLSDYIINAAKESALTCRAFANRNMMNPSSLNADGTPYMNERASCRFPEKLSDYNYENVASIGIWNDKYMKTICKVLMEMKIGSIESFESLMQKELGHVPNRKLDVAYLVHIIRDNIVLNPDDSPLAPRYILHDINGIMYIGNGPDLYNDAYMCQYNQRYVHSRNADEQELYEAYLTDFADMYLAERLKRNDYPEVYEVPPKIIQTLIQDCLTTAILGESRAPEGTSWETVRGVLMKYNDFWASPIELQQASTKDLENKLDESVARLNKTKNEAKLVKLQTRIAKIERMLIAKRSSIPKIIGCVWYINNITNNDTTQMVLYKEDFERGRSETQSLSAYQLWRPLMPKDDEATQLVATVKRMQRNAKEQLAQINNLQYIGLVNPNSGDFCLSDLSVQTKKRKNSQDIDKRSLHVGKICKFYPKQVVDSLYTRVVDDSMQDMSLTREKKCDAIKEAYKYKNLNSLDLNCGTQLKSRQ